MSSLVVEEHLVDSVFSPDVAQIVNAARRKYDSNDLLVDRKMGPYVINTLGLWTDNYADDESVVVDRKDENDEPAGDEKSCSEESGDEGDEENLTPSKRAADKKSCSEDSGDEGAHCDGGAGAMVFGGEDDAFDAAMADQFYSAVGGFGDYFTV